MLAKHTIEGASLSDDFIEITDVGSLTGTIYSFPLYVKRVVDTETLTDALKKSPYYNRPPLNNKFDKKTGYLIGTRITPNQLVKEYIEDEDEWKDMLNDNIPKEDALDYLLTAIENFSEVVRPTPKDRNVNDVYKKDWLVQHKQRYNYGIRTLKGTVFEAKGGSLEDYAQTFRDPKCLALEREIIAILADMIPDEDWPSPEPPLHMATN